MLHEITSDSFLKIIKCINLNTGNIENQSIKIPKQIKHIDTHLEIHIPKFKFQYKNILQTLRKKKYIIFLKIHKIGKKSLQPEERYLKG